MIEKGGRLLMGIGLDNGQLRKDAKESTKILSGIGNKAVAESSRIDSAYRRLARTAVSLGGAFTSGLLLKELYAFSNNFDKAMREVSTISGTVTQDIDGFKNSILDLTTKVPIAAEGATKALYQIISAGHDGAAGLNVLEVSARAAIGGVTDTATAADAITTVLNAYQMDASKAENISDQLFTTVRLGKTTFGELGHSISQAIPIAASFGIETDQVLAAVATLTKSGRPTAQAMTQIRAAINSASKVLGDGYFRTHTFQEGLQEIADMAGGSESELRKLVPEIEAMNGILGLTGINAKAAASDLDELRRSSGATDEAFKKMNATAEAQLQILKNNIFKKFHEIGDGAVDIVGEVAKFLNSDGLFNDTVLEDFIATLGVLIATVGTYKATLMLTNAVQLVGNKMAIEEETAAYNALLPIKERAKNADIEEAVAKGVLSEKRAEEIRAIREKVDAHLEEAKIAANTAIANAQKAKTEILATGSSISESRKKIATLKLERSEMILTGKVTEANAVQEKLYAESKHLGALKTTLKTQKTNLATLQETANSKTLALNTLQQNINNVSTNAGTKAKSLMAIATGRLTKAFKSLKLAIASNPWGFLLTAVTMAITAISLFRKESTKAESAQRKLNKSIKESEISITSERHQIDALFARLKAAKKGTEEYQAAKKAIISRYGNYLSKLGDEKKALNNIAAAYAAVTEAAKKAARARAMEKLQKEAADELAAEEEDVKKEVQKLLKKKFGYKRGDDNIALAETFYWKIKPVIEGEEITPEIENILKEFDNKKLGWAGGSEDERKYITENPLRDAINKMRKSQAAYKKIQAEANKLFGENIIPTTSPISTTANGQQFDILNASLNELQAQLPTVTTELDKLLNAKKPDKSLINAKKKEIDLIERAITKRENELRTIKEVKAQIEFLQKEQENFSKHDERYKNRANRIAALKKRLPDSGDESQPDSQYDALIAKQLEENERTSFEIKRKGVNDRIQLIEDEYDQEMQIIAEARKKAQEAAANEGKVFDASAFDDAAQYALLNKNIKIQIIVDEDEAATKKELDSILAEFETYEQKRERIKKDFDDKIAKLDKETQQDAIREGARQRDEALRELDEAMLRNSATLGRYYEDTSRKGIKELRKLANDAEALYNFLIGNEWNAEKGGIFGITEEQFNIISSNNGLLEQFRTNVTAIGKAADEAEVGIKKFSNGIKGIAEGIKNNDPEQFIKGLEGIRGLMQDVTKLTDALANSLRNLSEITGNKVLGEIADGLIDVMSVLGETADTASTGAKFGGITGAIVGGVLGLVSSVTGILARNKKNREELKKQIADNNMQEYLGELEVNRLWRERYEWAQKIGESTIAYMRRQGEELKKQRSANEDEQNHLWNKLVNTEYKSGEHFKKTGFFGSGKGKIVEEWSSLAGKSWDEVEALASQGKLSEEGMKYYEALKKAREEGENLADRQEEFLEKTRELATGTTFDSVVDGIVEGFKAGKRSAADFADSFEELLGGSIESAFRMMADEKSRAWYEKFAEYSEDGLNTAEIDQLRADWVKLNKDLAKDAENLETVTGGTIGEGERRTASSAIGVTASQESVNEVMGICTNIQSHTFTISENIKTLVFSSSRALMYLSGIENNTRGIERLSVIERHMNAMKSGIEDIRDKGLILKR